MFTRHTGGAVSDLTVFAKRWLINPRDNGAVVPSSEALARAMTQFIDPAGGLVLELGPGTGAFTSWILATGLPVQDLVLVEKHQEFVTHLNEKFPCVRIEQLDATKLASSKLLRTQQGFQAVISGLPLLTMSPAAQLRVLHGCFGVMQPEAALYQFTYQWRCPVATPVMQRLGLVAQPMARVWQNFPPATVFRISRQAAG